MGEFDLRVAGPPRVVEQIWRDTALEHFPGSRLDGAAFDLQLGPMPGNSYRAYIYLRAVGRFEADAAGARIAGRVEWTPGTRLAYGGTVAVFFAYALATTIQSGNPLGLFGAAVGGGALVVLLLRVHARTLRDASARMERLVGEVQALTRLQGGDGAPPQTHGRQFGP